VRPGGGDREGEERERKREKERIGKRDEEEKEGCDLRRQGQASGRRRLGSRQREGTGAEWVSVTSDFEYTYLSTSTRSGENT